MATKKPKHPKPQNTGDTMFGPHESGIPEQNSTKVEAPKLGSESIANFESGGGVPPNRNVIH